MATTDAAPVSAAPDASPPPPRRAGRLVVAIALFALLVIGYFGWRAWTAAQGQQRADQTERQQFAARFEALLRNSEQARRDADTLRSRLDDADKINQSLREQLLGLTERARLVEDAVANLADKRLSGHDALLLNEAEMLLVLGAERYTLFHDARASIEAYRLADAALAAADDAAFSTVRQSISAEVEAFGASGAGDTSAALGSLAALRVNVARLPAASRGLASAHGEDGESRWERVLAQFVRVRHGADATELAARHDEALARQLLALDLRDAEAALLARDESHYRAALADAQELLKVDFDAGADAVTAARTTLDGLAKVVLAPPPPSVLGAALKELRNLRATHALRQAPRPAETARPVEPARPPAESGEGQQ